MVECTYGWVTCYSLDGSLLFFGLMSVAKDPSMQHPLDEHSQRHELNQLPTVVAGPSVHPDSHRNSPSRGTETCQRLCMCIGYQERWRWLDVRLSKKRHRAVRTFSHAYKITVAPTARNLAMLNH